VFLKTAEVEWRDSVSIYHREPKQCVCEIYNQKLQPRVTLENNWRSSFPLFYVFMGNRIRFVFLRSFKLFTLLVCASAFAQWAGLFRLTFCRNGTRKAVLRILFDTTISNISHNMAKFGVNTIVYYTKYFLNKHVDFFSVPLPKYLKI
jgi:hypothetical protein